MSLDNMQLPAFLYLAMFKNNLVNTALEKNEQFLNSTKKIDYLGGNEKRIIFLSKDNQHKFLSEDNMKFLQGLLVACNLTIMDIAFVNISFTSITYQELTDQLNADIILIFEVTAAELDLPFAIPFFQAQNFQNQEYMLAPSFEELQKNKEVRKKLWLCLQKIFNIQKQK